VKLAKRVAGTDEYDVKASCNITMPHATRHGVVINFIWDATLSRKPMHDR
jgi:hypothetical protein